MQLPARTAINEVKCLPRYIGIGELARRTGESYHYIKKWTRQGRLPSYRNPGERVRYREDEAIEAVKRIRQESYRPVKPRGDVISVRGCAADED